MSRSAPSRSKTGLDALLPFQFQHHSTAHEVCDSSDARDLELPGRDEHLICCLPAPVPVDQPVEQPAHLVFGSYSTGYPFG